MKKVPGPRGSRDEEFFVPSLALITSPSVHIVLTQHFIHVLTWIWLAKIIREFSVAFEKSVGLLVCNRGITYHSITVSSREGSLAKPLSLLFLTPRPALPNCQQAQHGRWFTVKHIKAGLQASSHPNATDPS